jgi:hypothetical protein
LETTLHHQLKDYFRQPDAPIEVQLQRYRIDAVNGDRLVEIQRSGLSAIRNKIEDLLKQGFMVDLVKPIVARKRLIKLDAFDGQEVERRWSPYSGSILDLFDELLYFTRTFPHPRLRLLVPLITIEEARYPGHGRRRRHRVGDFMVKDRQIMELHETHEFSSAKDLTKLLPCSVLPKQFDTGDLARELSIPRHEAQRIAYVLKKTGALIETGKKRNAIRYRMVTAKESRAAFKAKGATLPHSRLARKILRDALAKHFLQKKAA